MRSLYDFFLCVCVKYRKSQQLPNVDTRLKSKQWKAANLEQI